MLFLQNDLHVSAVPTFHLSRVPWIFLANRGDGIIASCLHTMHDVALLGRNYLALDE
jgi:hypothetical protein